MGAQSGGLTPSLNGRTLFAPRTTNTLRHRNIVDQPRAAELNGGEYAGRGGDRARNRRKGLALVDFEIFDGEAGGFQFRPATFDCLFDSGRLARQSRGYCPEHTGDSRGAPALFRRQEYVAG